MSSAFWLCAATTTTSSVVSLGYSIAAVRNASRPERTFALYALSRSVALTLATATAVIQHSTEGLKTAATAMTLVQAGDAIIGLRNGDRLKTVGPAATAAANVAVLMNLKP